MTIRLSTGARNGVMRTNPMDTLLSGGFLFLFSGTQPATADLASAGTLLAAISIGGLGVTGLTFSDGDNAGEIKKNAGESWQGTGLAANTARWFRYQALDTNYATTLANAQAANTTVRIDGSIGVSGSDLVAASVAIAVGAPITIDTFVLRLPASIS
jgi:hypothetical protein